MPQTHLNEAPRIAIWIRALLAGDGTLVAAAAGGIWQSIAPAADASGNPLIPPFATYQRTGGSDLLGVGASRAFANELWTVKAVGPASMATETTDPISVMADRIDALLHGASGTTSDGRILGCNREDIVSYDEVIDGVIWSHLGGQYRVYAQPLTGA